jgi:hypothetical protein
VSDDSYNVSMFLAPLLAVSNPSLVCPLARSVVIAAVHALALPVAIIERVAVRARQQNAAKRGQQRNGKRHLTVTSGINILLHRSHNYKRFDQIA